MRVLYVEDNVLDAELTRRELARTAQDLDLDVVHSLDEATARLEQGGSSYDLVLSDLKLPDGDGLTLLARIRERGLPLAVVVISGAGDEQSVISALRTGADDYVVKDTVYLAHLPATLESALERFRATHARRGRSIRVLYAEDNALDADIVGRFVSRRAPHIRLDVVDTPQAVFRRLTEAEGTSYDLVLLDYRLPGTNALEILRELRQVHNLDMPVVLITGQGDEEIARQAMRLGAEDYVVKQGDYANKLPFVLENAFHRAQLAREQAALRKSEERYRNIVELAPDGIVTMNLAGMVTSCNSAFVALTGFGEDEIVGRHFTKIPTLHLDDIPRYVKVVADVVSGRLQGPYEFDWYHKDGSRRGGRARFSLVREGGRVTGVQAILTDITERRRAERLLQALNRAALAMERALTPDAIFDAVADELHGLGIFCAVFVADEGGEVLIPRYLSYEPGLVRTAEKLAGLNAAQFRMPVDAVDVFRRAVRERTASFVADAEGHARQLLPRPLKGFAGQIIRMLKVPKFIAAPLVVQDRVIGLLSVQSADLTTDDVPAVTAFAHQVAAAWHRAQLYEQARQEIAERKRMGQALLESEDRFRNVFENAPIGIYRTTPDGRILMANPALVRMLGYASLEELEQLDLEREGDPSRAQRAAFKRRLESEGEVTGLEAVWYKKDGSTLMVRHSARVVRDEGRDVLYYDGTVEDITGRQRAEQLLRALNQASLAMGSALTAEAVFGVAAKELAKLDFSCMVLPTNGDRTRLSTRYVDAELEVVRAAEKLTGLRREDFSFAVESVDAYRDVVWARKTVFVEDTPELVRQLLPNPMRGIAAQITRMTGPWKAIAAPLIVEDQVVGALSVHSFDLKEEDVPAVTAFAHQVAAAWRKAQLYEQAQIEIAERARAEEALRESEERFRALVQNSSDIIAILELDGTLRYISPSAEGVLGEPPESLVGQNPLDFVHPEDMPATQERLAAVLQQPGVPVGHELRIRHFDGSWVWLELFASNLMHVPSVRGLVINARDVTERKRLEEQFRQAQKMEAVGRLAGGIAHDFNNLLTAMQGYTSLLLSDLASGLPLDEAWKQSMRTDLTEIKLASDRAAGLTQQLLAFSRRQMLQPRILDLNDLVLNMENMLRRLIGEDIELSIEPAPSLGRVLADPVQVEQVILNLVVNARDAMPHGGRLAVEMANVELDEAFARGHPGSQQGSYVMLAVTDTGIGMSEEVRAHLFEPFFTTKEDGKGTGLGLATVYGIVRQSGGYIWPSSELGQGTSFRIYLPRAEVGDSVPGPRPEQAVLSSGTETILLVEDEEIVRDLARRILERQGYTMMVAGHPKEALDLARAHADRIDLLVTDVVMPGMSGRDLADRLLASRPETKVLYISGYTDDAIVQHGVLDPAVNFCQKPFRPGDLAHKVREVLDQGEDV